MRGFGSSLEQISNKLLSAEAAVEVVKPGNRVFVGTASASPFSLVEALERRKPAPPDVELFYFLTTGLAPLWVEQQSAYHHRCFFVGSEGLPCIDNRRRRGIPHQTVPSRRRKGDAGTRRCALCGDGVRDRLSVWQIRAGTGLGTDRDRASGFSRKSSR
jgi:hypothetical protein